MSPENLTRKILHEHLRQGRLEPGTDITLDVDQVLLEDATATMAAMQFEQLGVDEIAVPVAVVYVDHNVLQIDDKNMQDHHYLRTFCARYGLRYSPPGNGLSHYIHLERFGRPGHLLVGADSHSTMAGALGMFATGAGGLDVAVTLAGFGAELTCPRVVGVELTGSLPPAVEAKDVVLEILRRRGVRGGRGAVFEFHGEGLAELTVTGRATIANMIVETGATAAVFPSDEQTRSWLEAQHRPDDFRPLQADPGATYDERELIELSTLEPLVAIPHSPGNVVPVTEVEGTELVQVCVGSSVNSSYEDLATVAASLRGHSVAPGLQVTVTPGSRQILDTVVRAGVYQDLLAAGARVLEPICGPCIGIGQAPVKGEPSLRTFNRNFPGRSGTAEDQVYLCSPSTAAASAVTGRITDPRRMRLPDRRPHVPSDPSVVDMHITAPLPADERDGVVIERGDNLVPPHRPGRPPEDVRAKVGIVVGDDISTGDMAPDGVIGMAVWSNIALCAGFMFRRIDPEFHDRVHGWGGGLIIGGHNYGQGSSREHAALSPLHLGVRVVVAASFARIHRRNLIAVGILPLVLEHPSDRDRARVGQEWAIPGLAEALRQERESVTAETDEGAVSLRIDLSPREREIALAGGLLNLLAAR
ncbi:aconitate hydratase [Serinicoccus marinus]|uniref:aconitate hydratase n=1 Tax=Serinicoccus marinus TaxID=247333 RepID=UPI00248FE200|nr:aconitate hydratase [Serinicoccus marinus]